MLHVVYIESYTQAQASASCNSTPAQSIYQEV